MQEKDKDLAEPLATPAENAVRIMTVHASKGLSFRCFLIGYNEILQLPRLSKALYF